MNARQTDLIEFAHGNGTFRVRPVNAQKVRAALDAVKPRKPKLSRDSGQGYPDFTPGMTTGEYVKRFHTVNDAQHWAKMEYIHADRAAPMLDPTLPEVLEEPDPDYVAPIKVRKAPTARELANLVREAMKFAPADWTAKAAATLGT